MQLVPMGPMGTKRTTKLRLQRSSCTSSENYKIVGCLALFTLDGKRESGV